MQISLNWTLLRMPPADIVPLIEGGAYSSKYGT